MDRLVRAADSDVTVHVDQGSGTVHFIIDLNCYLL